MSNVENLADRRPPQQEMPPDPQGFGWGPGPWGPQAPPWGKPPFPPGPCMPCGPGPGWPGPPPRPPGCWDALFKLNACWDEVAKAKEILAKIIGDILAEDPNILAAVISANPGMLTPALQALFSTDPSLLLGALSANPNALLPILQAIDPGSLASLLGSDLAANPQYLTQAITNVLQTTASPPQLGITNGSAAAPGYVGEIATGQFTGDFPGYPEIMQTVVNTGNLPAGVWLLFGAFVNTGLFGAASVTMQPNVPQGFTTSMDGWAGVGTIDSTKMILAPGWGNTAQANPLLFTVRIDNSTNSGIPAGAFQVSWDAMRVR